MNANLCPFGGALEHIESSSWVAKLVRGYFLLWQLRVKIKAANQFLVLKRDIKTWKWQTKSFILHAACLTVWPVACGCWYCGFDMSGPDQFLVIASLGGAEMDRRNGETWE